MTEDGGSPLEEEILDYMKFGIFTDLGDEASLTEFSEVMRASDGIHAVKESYQIHSEQAFRAGGDLGGDSKFPWEAAGDVR